MGFGISDEVLEKIIMEPWLAPYRDGGQEKRNSLSTFNTVTVSGYTRNTSTLICEKEIVKTEKPTLKDSDNVLFLKAVLGELNYIFTGDTYSRFRSREVRQCFINVKEHFDSTCNVLDIKADSFGKSKRNKKAIDYLFSGITEQIFYIITHYNLTRKSLSNVITDIVSVMNVWNLNRTEESIEKRLFFSYYEERFGLIQSEFHCCPYCGNVLYKGLNNCPNCLRIVVEANHEELSVDKEAVKKQNHQILLIQQEMETARESAENLSKQMEYQQYRSAQENERLREEIQHLEGLVREKDLAIEAYKQLINGTAKTQSRKGKILVLGDSHLERKEMQEICTSVNIPFERLEWISDFSKIKGMLGTVFEAEKYEAVIVGAVPHKGRGIGNANSPVEALRKKFYVVEAKTFGGELKITRETFRKSLADVYSYMFTRGLL